MDQIDDSITTNSNYTFSTDHTWQIIKVDASELSNVQATLATYETTMSNYSHMKFKQQFETLSAVWVIGLSLALLLPIVLNIISKYRGEK